MSTRTHFVILEEPVSKWPMSIKALCGEEVIEPQTVMTLDIDAGGLTAPSTIWFCKDCRDLVLASRPEHGYVYGILPAEQAHRANLRRLYAERLETQE